MKQSHRIPALDGWRGIAILLVLLDHFLPSTWPIRRLGIHGVTFFFVLSGFLITSKLIAERLETGRVDMLAFYQRRAVRLMPCAWCYLLLLLVIRASVHTVYPGEFLSCIFFVRNYYPVSGASASTGHFWSLAIEEQFYLVWPWIFVLLGTKWARWVAAAGIAAGFLYRVAHHDLLFGPSIVPRLVTPLHLPALLMGCILALLLGQRRFSELLAKVPPAALFAALIFTVATSSGKVITLTEYALVALAIASGLLRESWIDRVLQLRVLRQLGLWSYSLYVWQQLPMLFHPNETQGLPMKLVAVAALSLTSYYAVERPLIRAWRSHAARRASAAVDSPDDSQALLGRSPVA